MLDSDDGLLKKRKKAKSEIEQENEEFLLFKDSMTKKVKPVHPNSKAGRPKGREGC